MKKVIAPQPERGAPLADNVAVSLGGPMLRVQLIAKSAEITSDEVWLKDVVFNDLSARRGPVASPAAGLRPEVVWGTIIAPRRPSVTEKHGWQEVVFDPSTCCFHRRSDGGRVRTALFGWVRPGKVLAFGARSVRPGASVGESSGFPRDVRVVGPIRGTWRGDMGGLNFEVAEKDVIEDALRSAAASWPGCVLVDGSDDWDAPEQVQVRDLALRWHTAPITWWHTGVSGVVPSGAVFAPATFLEFAARYRREFGLTLVAESGVRQSGGPARAPCGCYGGEGLFVRRL